MVNLLFKLLLVIYAINLPCYADVRAMTINTQWLWTPFDKQVDGSLKHLKDMSEKKYLDEVSFYAKQIIARNIDVVALSEIENEHVANDVVQHLNHESGDTWNAYFMQGRDTATGQDVAILSRLPYVTDSKTTFNFPSGFISGAGKAKKLSKIVGALFLVETSTDKKTVGVITAHLLSKRNETKKKSLDREKQALGLRKAIDKFKQGTDALIIMGDFNDYLSSPTLAHIKGTQLNSYKECDNFKKGLNKNEIKRWRRNIDHLLYSGLTCKAQYKLDLQGYSDHPAIYGELVIH